MSSDVAIAVRGLSKSYTIRHNQARHTTVGEALAYRLKHPLERSEREEFWALEDVSFDVKRGEVLGVIGRNGAGKSTLLKVLSRITAPTRGEVRVYGRVGSLLEVGTGFHPELTGSENIYLNGSILGMRRGEIDSQFDAIINFAGIEQFLDTPVKRYSSGMYIRLAFAVAAHLRSEVLLVDEVLAVGDAEFQSKCLGKLHDVALTGRTVLFVSHNLGAVAELCTNCLFFENGQVAFEGAVAETLSEYTSRTVGEFVPQVRSRIVGGPMRIGAVRATKEHVDPTETKTFEVDLVNCADTTAPVFVSGLVLDALGRELLYFDSRHHNQWFAPVSQTVSLRISSPWFRPGRYFINFYVSQANLLLDSVEHAAAIDVSVSTPYSGSYVDTSATSFFADFAMESAECTIE